MSEVLIYILVISVFLYLAYGICNIYILRKIKKFDDNIDYIKKYLFSDDFLYKEFFKIEQFKIANKNCEKILENKLLKFLLSKSHYKLLKLKYINAISLGLQIYIQEYD